MINQDYGSKEIIVIDGGSKDHTVDIIEQHKDHIAYWISEKDKGIYDAMNKGIKASSGEWLYFLGSDDQLLDNALNRISLFLQYPDYHFVYGNVFFKHSNARHGRVYNNRLLAERVICHQAVFTHQSLFERYGHFDSNMKSNADYAFMLKAFGDDPGKNKYSDVDIALYNEKGFSDNHIDLLFLIRKRSLCKRYLGVNDSNEHYYSYLSKTGLDMIEKGLIKEGLKLSLASILLGRSKFKKLRDTLYYIGNRFLKS